MRVLYSLGVALLVAGFGLAVGGMSKVARDRAPTAGAWFMHDGGTLLLQNNAQEIAEWLSDGGCNVLWDGGMAHEESKLCEVLTKARAH